MWRYAVIPPDWIARRYPSLRPPTELHLIRGCSLGLVIIIAALGIGGVSLVAVLGHIRIGEPESFHLIFAVGALGLSVLLLREFLKLHFDAEDLITAIHVMTHLLEPRPPW
jgi:hypothetical protein